MSFWQLLFIVVLVSWQYASLKVEMRVLNRSNKDVKLKLEAVTELVKNYVVGPEEEAADAQ